MPPSSALSLPKAMIQGDPHDLDQLLTQHPVDLNQPVGDALPLVIVARQGDASERLAILLAHGADPRRAPHALLNAVHQNDADSVALLIAHGADPRYDGSAALEMAGEYGLTERFHQLLTLGASESDPRGARGRGLLTQAQWGRVLDAVRRRNLDDYHRAWVAQERDPLNLNALLLTIVGTTIEPGAPASDTVALTTMLHHVMPLVKHQWMPLRSDTPRESAPGHDAFGATPLTAQALVRATVLAGNQALAQALTEYPEVVAQVDMDVLVRVVGGTEDASPSRWLALKALLGDQPLPENQRDQVGDALWASLYRVAMGSRPAWFNALLEVAHAWNLPMDLRVMLLDAVVKPGSGCVRTLAQRASPELLAQAMAKALAHGHHRGYNDLWNDGRRWPLSGTPVEGFDDVGPFPLELLRAAIEQGTEQSALDWLTERGAKWLPHEVALRTAIGKNSLPAWSWLDRQLAVERPPHERRVLERQADATLQETHAGDTAAPLRPRSRL